MKIEKGIFHEDFHRDLYWTRVLFISDDEKKRSQILTCSSVEYWHQKWGVPMGEKVSEEKANQWVDQVVNKWSKLGEEIFNQDKHYDVYATTPEGEANGIDFLLKEIK